MCVCSHFSSFFFSLVWLLLVICFVLKLREKHIIYIYIYNLYTHLCLSQHLRGASFFSFFLFFFFVDRKGTQQVNRFV